ncbi:hypothetical protein [Alteraurantiacibacter aquimixticola]|uniref:DUF11 domain-containing protein n=1 Tax=Alteraurantiacibacter aquimixticola TaxID=2489173 RepID=A0A4T3F479_9SPHN|nr:hypothetical protein [Alteraurantiacibacter aquimixticola]TIX51124.1 hypothetical protein E5222_01190 [Alteraurantiacibacter aquimixticola]
MKTKRFASLFAIFALATAVPAQAEDVVSLTGNVLVERTVVENGESRIVYQAPDRVVPGDKLVFSTDYDNTTSQDVEQFVVTNPVPAAVTVAPESAAELDVSVDGGQSWGRLADLTIAGTDGAVRAATASDVTHIRWVLPMIAAGENGSLTYNAIVR